MIYSAIAGALIIGTILGLRTGRRSLEATDAFEAKLFKDLSEVPLDGILTDARERGKSFGVSISKRDLRGFVLQGVGAFNIPYLRVEARLAGEGPEIEDTTHASYKEFKRTPYRCVLYGKRGYYTFLGKEVAEASECWTLGTEGRIENKLMVTYYVWERLQWVESTQQWALFSPEQQRRFYRSFIERNYNADAVRQDTLESKALFLEVGSSLRKKRSALAVAFRTRARRAGAMYRLNHL